MPPPNSYRRPHLYFHSSSVKFQNTGKAKKGSKQVVSITSAFLVNLLDEIKVIGFRVFKQFIDNPCFLILGGLSSHTINFDVVSRAVENFPMILRSSIVFTQNCHWTLLLWVLSVITQTRL